MKTLRILIATGLALVALVGVTLALAWWQPTTARAEDAVTMPDPPYAPRAPHAPAVPAAPQTLSLPWLSDDDVADAPYHWWSPTVDGRIDPGEYAGAGKVTFPGYGGDVEVFFKQDAITLYVAFELPDKVNKNPWPDVSIFLDTNHDGGSDPQPDDFWFLVWRNGPPAEWQGNGSTWISNSIITWTYGLTETMSGWSVEFGIPFTKLGISTGNFKELGLALSNGLGSTVYFWPAGATSSDPDTWGSLVSSSGSTAVPSGWDTFYWKPGPWEDYAPSGMPDFDQKQVGWVYPATTISTHCGPVAMANSLWWFDSKFETLTGTMPPVVSDTYRLVTSYGAWDDHYISNTIPLVNDLAFYFNTNDMLGSNAWLGTRITDMYSGTLNYLRRQGLWDDYIVTLVEQPEFAWVADEVMRSEDVILLLGFYEWIEDPPGSWRWSRVGGHYVNVAGVDPMAGLIAFSDPFVDNAESGMGMGRVLSGTLILPHVPGHTPDVHNDAGNISHDIYPMIPTTSTGGIWGPEGYPTWMFESWLFAFMNPHPWIPTEEWRGDPNLQVEVEFALAVSPYTWKSSGEWIPEGEDPIWGFWQPWEDYAPNGVPDFDEKQDGWSNPPFVPVPPAKWTFCGPAAAANSLWWFDSKFEPNPVGPPHPPPPWGPIPPNDNYPLVQSYDPAGVWDDHDPLNVDDPTTPWPPPSGGPPITPGEGEFIEDLALYFKTDQIGSGTIITDMYRGLISYTIDHKLRQGYVITQVKSPEFWWVAEEVEVSEDVILLLGFWEDVGGGEFKRLGGHYVTIPGVDKQGGLVAFSDPYYNGAEYWWPYAYPSGWPTVMGRVADGWLYPHPPYFTHVYTIHNDAGNISHDVYYVAPTDSPGGVWGPWEYVEGGFPEENFLEQNGETVPWSGGPVQAEVDWAIAVSPVADVWITKTVVPTTVSPGDWVTFTIDFLNYGNDAEDVVISDALPSGLTGATYTYSLNYLGTLTHTNTYTWIVGTLRWLEGGTITVTAQVDPSAIWPSVTVITNTVEITTTTTEQYQVSQYANRAQAPFTVTFTPTLAYDWHKLVNGEPWVSGFAVTAQTSDTITVTDVVSASQPFTLTEVWNPAHLALTSYYTQGGGSVITAAGWLTWTGPAGQLVTLTKEFHVEPCTWTQTILEEILDVGGNLTEARPITINKLPPRLQITSDYQTEVYAGRNATFTLTYSNPGGYENDVWITNTFPISAPFVSSSPAATRQAGDGTWAAWDVGDVGPPGSIRVTVAISDVLVPCTWITITDWIYDHVGDPAAGVTTTFHVTCAEVTGVDLVITNTGTIYTDTIVYFSADIAPDDATKPYSYTVFKDGGPGSLATSSDDPLVFTDTFGVTGTHAVTIHVWNCAMTTPVTDVVTFTVYAPGTCVDLTNITIYGATSGGPGTYTFTTSYAPPGASTPITYAWDNSGTADTSIRTLPVGVHTLTVTATNCTSALVTDTHVITIECEPITWVDFDWSPYYPDAGKVVTFTISSLLPTTATTPITYQWSFGDTYTATGNPVTHTYAVSGTYSVYVSAYNPCSGPISSTHDVHVTGEPDISVNPLSLSATLDPGDTTTDTLTIGNESTATADLNWSLAENPAASWLTEVPTNGVVAPAGSDAVVVTFDAASMTPGIYVTTLDITSNDPDESPTSVPVTLTVNCIPVTTVTLDITNTGAIYTDTLVHFSADIEPDNATKPYTYRVGFDGFVGPDMTSSDDPLTFSYTFGVTGTHIVTIAVWNCAVSTPVTDVITFTVREQGTCVNLTDITIFGDTSGYPGVYTFTTDYDPFDASIPITYTWDNGSHADTSTRTLSVGIHTLVVTATNCTAAMVTDTHTITITSACQDVNITNLTSDSPVDLGQAMRFTATVTGDTPITYSWDFGGAGAQGGTDTNPTFTYAAAGAYTVTLDVENDCPSTDTHSIPVTVNPAPPPPPEPAWNKQVYVNDVLTGAVPIIVFPSDTVEIVDRVWVTYTGAVTFTLVETWTASLELTSTVFTVGSVVSSASSLTWEATGVASNTWHVLTKTFLVTTTGWVYDYVTETLWVEDATAQPADRLLIFAEGGVCLPVNILNLTSDSPVDLGQSMRFTATIIGSTPITYAWDFDSDGTPEQSGVGLNVVSYTYLSAGTYTVTLDGENDCPSTDTHSIHVTVNPPPCVEVTTVTLSITNTGAIYTDTVVHFSADIAPDGADKPCTYTVDYGSGPGAPATSSADPLVFTHTFAITGAHAVTVAVWNCEMTEAQAKTDMVTTTVRSGGYSIYLPLVMRNYP